MAFVKSEESAKAKAGADRESEVRQIAKEAGFLIRKNGCFYTLIEPEFMLRSRRAKPSKGL
jgi:hypothetical protein